MGVLKALCIVHWRGGNGRLPSYTWEGAFEGHGEGTGRWTEPRLGCAGGRLSLLLQPFADTDSFQKSPQP